MRTSSGVDRGLSGPVARRRGRLRRPAGARMDVGPAAQPGRDRADREYMALTKSLLVLTALPLTLGGCGALGLGSSAPSAGASPAASGQPWVVTAQGTA